MHRPIPKTTILLFIVLTLCAGMALDAHAIRYQPRPNWVVGVGFGLGRGELENGP